MTELLIYTCLSAVLLVALGWVFLFEYRRYRVRVFRYHLFKARDNLFAAARSGALSFDDRAYGMARSVINGLILKADALSFTYIAMLRVIGSNRHRKERATAYDTRLQKACAKLSPEGKAAVKEALFKTHVSVISHLFHISVILGVPVHLCKLTLWIEDNVFGSETAESVADEKIGSWGKRMNVPLRDLDRQAFAVGASTAFEGDLAAA
jgi:hypothetical protein